MRVFDVYTDGATSFNGYANAVGGAAYVIVEDNNLITEESFHIKEATNNICELFALIKACEKARSYITSDTERINIYSDSAYCINCYRQGWYRAWENNGWQTSSKKPVKNKELWEALIPYFKNKLFKFHKVKGHNNNHWNEYVDRLAVAAKEN